MGRGVSGWSCKELEDMVKDAGWEYDCSDGGHRFYVHPRRKGIVTIPWHRRKAVKRKTAANIFRVAGVKPPR